MHPCPLLESHSDEADCDSVLSSCERSGTAIREKTGCCGPTDRSGTLDPCQAVGLLGGGWCPGWWVVGHSSNIDNCVVIILGRLRVQPPPSPTTNLPTGSRQTLKLSAGARVITLWNNMQICTESTRQVPTGPDAPQSSGEIFLKITNTNRHMKLDEIRRILIALFGRNYSNYSFQHCLRDTKMVTFKHPGLVFF